MTFYVGQRVVCINDCTKYNIWLRKHAFPNLPKKGGIYTIRSKFILEDEVGLRLHEVINPVVSWTNHEPAEGAFLSTLFRPLVDRKTDISIFTKMLTDTTLEVVP